MPKTFPPKFPPYPARNGTPTRKANTTMEHTTSTPNNELAHAPNHPQDRHTPMDTNDL